MNTADGTNKSYRPRGILLWLFVFIVAFFFGAGLLSIVLVLGSPAVPAGVLAAFFFFALGMFFLLNLLGFRAQHVTVRQDGFSFALAPLGNNLVMPWTLRRGDLPWSEVRALDVKSRSLTGPQRVYVLRTSAGEFVFVWPQWPEAEELAAEIIRRSGAATSEENMEAPPAIDPGHPGKAMTLSGSERFLRGCGLVMLIVIGLLTLLCVIALFGVKPEERGGIVRALLVLALGAASAQALRKYRRIR